MLISFVVFLSPFCSYHQLHFDLFASAAFFLLFSQYRHALLWSVLCSVYLDTVMALPLGNNCVVLLLIWGMEQLVRSLVHKKSFLQHWGIFTIIYLIVTVFKLWMGEQFFKVTYHFSPELFSVVLTVFCYPLLCRLLTTLMRQSIPLIR